jgi:hypothetical protein
MDLLKYQILEPTKTFILNIRLISCLLKPVNLSICSHASNTKEYEKGFKTNPLSPNFFLNKDFG